MNQFEQRDKTKEELMHVGILGMKWGRRSGSSTSGRDALGRSKGSQDHQVALSIKKKHLKDMSNEELKQLTTRLGLEKQFKDLQGSKNGSKFLSGVLEGVGKQLASKYIASGIETGAPLLLAALKKLKG